MTGKGSLKACKKILNARHAMEANQGSSELMAIHEHQLLLRDHLYFD
jgi:hypothetical protein